MANEKEVILVIVEGASDKESLELILTRLYKDKKIHFQIVRGDITTDNVTNIGNVLTKINEKVRENMGANFYKPNDISQIVHLVDTDGAFISDEDVIFSDTDKLIYTPEKILTKSVEETRNRNHKKAAILGKLSKTNKIGKIPYCTYFFSSNLEHVLHNEPNLDPSLKMSFANKFSDRFADDPENFIGFINNPAFAVKGNYNETWNFIKLDKNSLRRYCNFHLFFK